jgi:PIN domain nuclease of toxin-antitoxin system
MLAMLYGENGSAAVIDALADPETQVLASSVNLCEVVTKLVLGGADATQVSADLKPFLHCAVEFDLEHAVRAGQLARITRPFGLSLGDRACLALAASHDATAWTTDVEWKKLKLGVKVRLLRG